VTGAIEKLKTKALAVSYYVLFGQLTVVYSLILCCFSFLPVKKNYTLKA